MVFYNTPLTTRTALALASGELHTASVSADNLSSDSPLLEQLSLQAVQHGKYCIAMDALERRGDFHGMAMLSAVAGDTASLKDRVEKV
ncbi:hypothetical protein KIPB_013580 [Kipferlia bialata]|uniref:Uncharacterized protein n=1 Tax=Kipferlia bialata TaxID=797122 RepID=A0A9K3D7N5_9EUKA|nr:hypothetical protein KIPB_013580 [Kipferlia bialata]|eukprot:g13580.t1